MSGAGSRPRLAPARAVMLTIDSDVAGTELALAAPRPNRDRAVAVVESMRTRSSVPALAPRASGIADAVRGAIAAAIPYASGAELEAELRTEDTAPDGSRSAAHFRFRFQR